MDTNIINKFEYFKIAFENAKGTPAKISELKIEIKAYSETLSKEEKKIYASLVTNVVNTKLNSIKHDLNELKRNHKREGYLEYHGTKYSLKEWLPISTYVAIYQLSSTNLVSMWIERGIIPSTNVIIIPELNYLKLIKNIKYN